MTTYPALPIFVLALIALFIKTTVTSLLQVASRIRQRSFITPEDAALFGKRATVNDTAFAQRCSHVWRNDVENLPLFLMLALSYVLLGATAESARNLFAIYVVLRYVHTIVYLRGLQPWRAILWLSSIAVCIVIAVKIAGLALAMIA